MSLKKNIQKMAKKLCVYVCVLCSVQVECSSSLTIDTRFHLAAIVKTIRSKLSCALADELTRDLRECTIVPPTEHTHGCVVFV